MTAAIRVLYVDDEPDLLDLGKVFLERSGDFTVTTITNAPEALRLLEQEQFDAIIADYQMPGMDGIQFLVLVRSRFGQIPFILFTGRGREEVVIKAINSGVDFYLQKGGEPGAQFAELSHKIRQAVERKSAERELRESERRLHSYIDNAPEGVFIADEKGRFLEVNPAACRITGYETEELLGMHLPDLLAPESLEAGAKNFKEVIESGHACSELLFRHKDGSLRHWLVDAVRLSPTRFLGFVKDITKRKLAEEALAENEKKYRNLYESSADGIASVSMDGHIIEANNAFCVMTGYTLRELGQLTYYDLTEEKWHEMEERILREQVVIRGFSDIYEKEYIRKDGSVVPVALRTWLLRDCQGDPLGMWAIVRDITERKRAEEARLKNTEELHAAFEHLTAAEEELKGQFDALSNSERMIRESEERFDQLAGQSRTLVWEVDAQGIYTYVSKVFEIVLGYRPDELVGRMHFSDLRPGSGREAFRTAAFAIFEQKEPFRDLVSSVQAKDGRFMWFSTNGIPLINADGTLQGYRGNDTDITERKQAENTLFKINQKLNVLSQLTRQDLTTQIFILNGYLEMAKTEATGQDGIIKNIESGERAIRSIKKITEFTKDYQNMGEKPPKWQNVKLAFLFGLSHISIGEIRHSIETENLEIFADPLLEKAFLCILGNSLEHGGHVSLIRMWHTVTPDGVALVFEDNGTGIPHEKKEQIFLPGEGARASVRGLFFVREILDITGITIRENGEPGKGARFEMAVPKGSYRMKREGVK